MNFKAYYFTICFELQTKENAMKLDFIKQIMSEFDQSNVTKMKVEIDDLKIELEKESEKVEYAKPL